MSTMYVNKVQELNVGSGVHIPGHVIQVVDTSSAPGGVDVQNTTFTDTGLSLSITPKFATSKILITCTQEVQAWNTSSYATARWRIVRNIGGGAFTAIYQDASPANGNIFYYDYGNIMFALDQSFNDYLDLSYGNNYLKVSLSIYLF